MANNKPPIFQPLSIKHSNNLKQLIEFKNSLKTSKSSKHSKSISKNNTKNKRKRKNV